MRIQVKPVPQERWHGKKGVDSFKRPHTIPALVDPNTMTYATGLDYTKKVYEGEGGEMLTEAEHYGKLIKQDLSNQFDTEKLHPFWDSKMASIKMENRTMIFNTENPLDYVRVKVMKASKYVANSLVEFENGEFPEATHVIYDESEEVESRAAIIEITRSAIIETSKLNTDKKVNLIMVLSSDGDYLKAINLKGKAPSFIEVELSKLIDKDPEAVIDFLNRSPEVTSTHALVLEALQKNVLHKEGHKVKYHESTIGESAMDAAEYLNRPEQQEFKIRILAQVND